MSISRKGREQPVHVRLRQRAGSLNEEIRKKRSCITRIIPVNLARVVAVELGLDDDGPDVNAEVQENDSQETQLSSTALADAFQVENKAQTEASDDTEEGRD